MTLFAAMNNFNNRGGSKGGHGKPRGGNDRGGFGGRGKFGGDRRGDDRRGGDRRERDDRPMQKFSAMCDSCHKKCEVPFRPSGDKPVYCSDCFGKKNQDGPRDRGGDRSPRREERPSHAKPSRDEQYDKGGIELVEIKRQLATIESRLNRILDVLNPPTAPQKKEKREKPAKAVVDVVALSESIDKATKPVAVKKVVKKTAKKAAKKTAKKAVKKATKKST